MSPKIPRKSPATSVKPADTAIVPPHRSDTLPDALLPHGMPISNTTGSTLNRAAEQGTGSNRAQPPAVEIHEMPAQGLPGHSRGDSIDRFWLSQAFLRGLQPADAEGFRLIVGRRFVDVEYQGVLHTTHVGLDESLGAYRMKLLTERVASGPIIAKDNARPTWRLTEQIGVLTADASVQRPPVEPVPKRPAVSMTETFERTIAAKRPRLSETPVDIDLSLYRHVSGPTDAPGYYQFESRLGYTNEILYALPGKYGNYVRVDPPDTGLGSRATHLKDWTDLEIWQLYGLHGQAMKRFRIEAQASGRPPQWAEPIPTDNPFKDLLAGPLRWMHPSLTPDQRWTVLQPYNLLPSQLTRLQQHLKTELTMPAWANAHKRLMDDVNNPHRLDQFSQDAIEELNLKRSGRHAWYHPEASMTTELREALLAKLGYQRNANHCLYRTDIPALFRGDERTPFELANDDAMLPRYAHRPGATTHKPLSATFSLREGQTYASAPDPEYLEYNSQTNKYPGRADGDPAPDSDASDSDSSSSSDWSDTSGAVALDRERNYERIRERQTEMFLYVLDTRSLEVVPREENDAFNSDALANKQTWFPSDNHEGLISVTKKGLDADRIWLLHSTLTKAAPVKDIRDQAGRSAERIESATHAGRSNQSEYDRLIDAVEAAGKPILRLSGNKNEFGYDITWPE